VSANLFGASFANTLHKIVIPSAVSRDKSVRRSAQDDGFVGSFDAKRPEQVSSWDDVLGYFPRAVRSWESAVLTQTL
jgi:hypothetical protein